MQEMYSSNNVKIKHYTHLGAEIEILPMEAAGEILLQDKLHSFAVVAHEGKLLGHGLHLALQESRQSITNTLQ